MPTAIRRRAVLVLLALSACAGPTQQQRWGRQLARLQLAKAEDVSMILGAPPARCETLEPAPPGLGVRFNTDKTKIAFVRPGGPGDKAGLRAGDEILRIAGREVKKYREVVWAISFSAKAGVPLEVETERGTFKPVPESPKVDQCYWERGEFRATCRLFDGYVVACQSTLER